MGVMKDSKSVIIVLKGWYIVLVSNVRVLSNTNQMVKARPFPEKCRGASITVHRHIEKCIQAFNILYITQEWLGTVLNLSGFSFKSCFRLE